MPFMPPSPSPSPSPSHTPSHTLLHHHHHHHPPPPIKNSSSPSPAVNFSPPIIAMVVVVAAAFVIVTYCRLIARHLKPPLKRLIRRFNRRRFLPSSAGDVDSLQYDSATLDGPHLFSPYGLDESVIKTIPFSLYTPKLLIEESRRSDCAVCLLDFEHQDYVRTLPICSHTFHLDCIDAWLRSHANCPLCRAGVLCSESPFTPLMAARIRPDLDDHAILHFDPTRSDLEAYSLSPLPEITPCIDDNSPRRINDDHHHRRDNFLLKRSYSFGFERSLASERMVVDTATASPWRYRRGSSSSSFWSKRPSPFGSLGKTRVFSFRYYRGMKSPFFRRRGFFPFSESSVRYAGGGGGSSSRRSKSIASPMFLRSSATAMTAGVFSSSRLRCGDPEALLSPERFSRR